MGFSTPVSRVLSTVAVQGFEPRSVTTLQRKAFEGTYLPCGMLGFGKFPSFVVSWPIRCHDDLGLFLSRCYSTALVQS